MNEFSLPAAGTMIALDVVMIVYTLWVLSTSEGTRGYVGRVAAALAAWLGVLHLGLSRHWMFPADISGIGFFGVILLGVAAVGAILFGPVPVRRLVLALDQRQLLLFQGVRVFFGATFLMQAATGVLPKAFGVLDGYTHVGAGFFGLVAAYCVAAGQHGARRAWFANIFGLADILIVASTLALVLLPTIGPFHSMMYAVFLPAPLWLWAHVVSIVKLIRTADAPSTPGAIARVG